jgi:hypothetical protein
MFNIYFSLYVDTSIALHWIAVFLKLKMKIFILLS